VGPGGEAGVAERDGSIARLERDLVAITSAEAAAPPVDVARLVEQLRTLRANV